MVFELSSPTKNRNFECGFVHKLLHASTKFFTCKRPRQRAPAVYSPFKKTVHNRFLKFLSKIVPIQLVIVQSELNVTNSSKKKVFFIVFKL